MKTLTWQKPGQQNVAQELIKIIINYVAELRKKKSTETEEEEKAGNVVQYRDKDAVLSGLEQTLPYLRGKDRADVLMKIADLQQMKKDENTEEEETVHYYLPLQCYRCSLFIADRAKRKAEEAEKPDYI